MVVIEEIVDDDLAGDLASDVKHDKKPEDPDSGSGRGGRSDKQSAIKKGFLNEAGRDALYGPEGSEQGTIASECFLLGKSSMHHFLLLEKIKKFPHFQKILVNSLAWEIAGVHVQRLLHFVSY